MGEAPPPPAEPHRRASAHTAVHGERRAGPAFAAIDLGTNNCRLLIARPVQDGFQVVDSHSRIVRLGEGIGETGALSEAAMDRAVAALRVCAGKMRRHRVAGSRSVATQACRSASNGAAFLERVHAETGIRLDVIDPAEEAQLAAMGCVNLIAPDAEVALVVDIGGGSTELSWVDASAVRARGPKSRATAAPLIAWSSTPVGVVSLAERFPERPEDRCAWYDAMCAHVRQVLVVPPEAERLRPLFDDARAHLIGTSGTVTSLAGVHLGLERYDRNKVDGAWVSRDDALAAARRLQAMCHAERAAEPCIGRERADLVLAGCAILEVVSQAWPSDRLRVADRGLREGLLMTLMAKPKRRRRGGRRRRKTGRKASHAPSPGSGSTS